MFDSHGNLDVLGRLATDRPLVVKFYGGYNIARNTQIGAFVYVGSGTPMTTYVNTVNQTEVFVEGRGDMGRTPVFSKTDLLVSHEMPMAGNKRLRAGAERAEPLQPEDGAAPVQLPQPRRRRGSRIVGNRPPQQRPLQGLRLQRHDQGTSDGANAHDPRYGMDDLFEAGTQGQVSVKFLF